MGDINSALLAPVTMDDIHLAVKELGGELPKKINETEIVLVPIVNLPESIGQLRPISCCNFMYKIISRILVAIPSYAMSIIRFPKNLCAELSSEMARFWWRKPGKPRGIHWKRRELISIPKVRGGMGFIDFFHQNIALLAKQSWRDLENLNALWVRVLKRQKSVTKRWALDSGRWKLLNIQKDRWFPHGDLFGVDGIPQGAVVANLLNQESPGWDNQKVRRKLVPSGVCIICNEEPETVEHCQLRCPWTIPIIYSSQLQVSPTNPSSRDGISQAWRPPPPQAVKFNCDAAFNIITNSGVVAVVAMDHEGRVISISTERISAPSALVAEALAVRAALILQLVVVGTNRVLSLTTWQVIEGIRSQKGDWTIQDIISDTKRICSYLPHCGFLWINRDGNRVAHTLADISASQNFAPVSLSSIPPAVRSLVEANRILLQRNLQLCPP
ncbi:Ribonuclease H-like superfamily [Sesbania bispinosa]|nr:Ribonuclease H-like superfamily [Sesbania bispinosa]